MNFEVWRMELDQKNQLLLRGSEDMLKLQEAFVTKQGSIMATLDRLFSLYDSLLYESRALKMCLFYALSLVFLHFITSAKQVNSARPLLYTVLSICMAAELYLMKTHGALLKNQQWLKSQCYWIRASFTSFSALAIVFFILTYRDINWRNHQLLLEIHRKLSEPTSQQARKIINSHRSCLEEFENINGGPPQAMRFHRSFILTPSSWKQLLASKITRRVHKLMRRHRSKGGSIRRRAEKDDALRDWMASRGMDLSSLDHSDNSDDSENDPDFECPSQMSYGAVPSIEIPCLDRYMLRSQCNNRCHDPTPWRTHL